MVRGQGGKGQENAYEAGLEFYRAGDCLAATAALKPLAATEPRADLPLGTCFFESHAYGEAVIALASYVQQFPSDTEALHLLAMSYEKSGRNSDALNAIHYYVVRHPDSSAGQVELGRFYFETGDKEKSAAAFSSALEKAPDDPAALVGLGQIATSDGRWAEAVEDLKHAGQIAPGAAAPFKALGDVYAKQGKYQDALGPYQHAFGLSPSDYATAKSLAKCYFLLNQLDEVAKVLRSPTLEQAKDLGATDMMVKALAGDQAALADYLRVVIALNPENTIARSRRAQLLTASKQMDEAVSEYSEILKLEKDHPDPEICYRLAEVYEARNDLKNAHEYYRVAADSAAATPAMHLALARVDLALNDPVGAQGELTKVTAPQSESFECEVLQLETYLRSGSWDSANALATQMLAKDPNNAKVLDLEAQVALKQQRYDEGAGYLERLFQTDPTSKPARYRLVRLYISHPDLKRDDRAKELLKEFIAREENDPEGYLLLAEFYRARKDKASAKSNYELGFTHMPNPTPSTFAWAYTSYAIFLANDGDLENALANSLRAVQLTPEDGSALFDLGVIYIKLGKTSEAEQVIEKLRGLNPESADELQQQLHGSFGRRSKSGVG